MLVRISGTLKDYAWGSKHLIQDQFGLGSAGASVAEVWFGTHPAGASTIIAAGQRLEDATGQQLPFLVKLLAAATPLSIQVHPNAQQAKAGFEKEQALGLALDNPTRNYKDPSHKPELLVAISPFEALCGFRPLANITQLLTELAASDPDFQIVLEASHSGIRKTFEVMLGSKDLAASFPQKLRSAKLSESAAKAVSLANRLLEQYPADTGALVSMLMNHVQLAPGEAIFLPAGNLHAYLSGLGFEVMASSDNVIRGGLTTKHIDIPELLSVCDFAELSNPKVEARRLAMGLAEYSVPASEFKVYKAEVSATNLFADLDLPEHALVLGISGEVAVSTSLEQREVVKKADAVYLSRAKKFSLTGSGEVFVVTS